jgi:hypothetical protein
MISCAFGKDEKRQEITLEKEVKKLKIKNRNTFANNFTKKP